MRPIKTYTHIIKRWANIAIGNSYYHVSQPVGKYVIPNKVHGYYNDLTKKANWNGYCDNDEIPVNILSNGSKVYFPITITQMALGIYDLWIGNKDDEHKNKFLKLSNWLKDNQDENGGWSNPWNYLRPTTVSNYGGITQGEAISVLIRAYLLTDQVSYLESSRKAFLLMIRSVKEGGCCFYEDDNLYIEEYPEFPRSTVLNGWIFAIFGIYDLMLIAEDRIVKEVFLTSLKTLENSINLYNTGYWTFYDLHKNIASPFYHSLHISLLEALYKISGSKTICDFADLLIIYRNKTINRSKALAVKAFQQLKSPPGISIVQ